MHKDHESPRPLNHYKPRRRVSTTGSGAYGQRAARHVGSGAPERIGHPRRAGQWRDGHSAPQCPNFGPARIHVARYGQSPDRDPTAARAAPCCAGEHVDLYVEILNLHVVAWNPIA